MFILNATETALASHALRTAAKAYESEAANATYPKVQHDFRAMAAQCRLIASRMDERENLRAAVAGR